MLIVDLDNNEHNWTLVGNIAHAKQQNKSSLHLRARTLIGQLYPTLQVLEEISIPLRRSETLYLDFYLPLKKTCIETHGEQHYKFIGHYHHTKLGFLKHQRRDREKAEWCKINNIQYIALPYNETDEEWIARIKGHEHKKSS
jgi:hypothetical protein